MYIINNMKKKIKVTLNGKTIEGEVEIRNLDHINAQKNIKSQVFRDKTKYNRKVKHKNNEKD